MTKTILIVLFISCSVLAQKQVPSIIFVSDTQQPLWIETLRLKEHDNEKAARAIFNAIEQESTAVGIFHLGDITSMGMFDSYWHTFDEFRKNIRVPFYPVIGNHEYYLFKKPALDQLQNRFPAISATWYSVVIKSVAIIILNSNFSKLSDDEKTQQDRWYSAQLSGFESDSTVRAIIVLCHHSPYTNSTIVDPSQEVQSRFVEPFVSHHKTMVFISGHAHAYEHFQKDGKEFLVIGGGGGLLHPLLTGTQQRSYDMFSQALSLRFFHFAECSFRPNSLLFSIKKFRNDATGFDGVDTVSVVYRK